ncbi:MAG TPA: nickel pincer cofactor biosynthesis protein LarC [Spirochaetia bacterium]|nr:nickel pincer cofactor biosynthesis protein LarC [Spirochaetia bacterium]
MSETILYYDCFAGISGDMNLGAMVDLGVPEAHLRDQLALLGVHGYELRLSRESRRGISGTRAEVGLDASLPGHSHVHRNFGDIRKMIEGSGLEGAVKTRSLAIFTRVAEAEAKVHGVPIDEVRFHEVGAIDSIVDIVGAAVCIEYVKPDQILCSTVELGTGFVKSQHGTLPVPAPATAQILRDAPVKSATVPFEMTTPTGAAILAASVQGFTDDKRFVIRRVGYGVGHRDTEVPNVLRVFLGESLHTQDVGVLPTTAACLLECNFDDMSAEVLGYLSDALLASGASDVYFTSIMMKKSRPAVKLSALCDLAVEGTLAEMILKETTTFGLRRIRVEKTALKREVRTVETSLGAVRVKVAFLNGRRLKSKPEYEDCRRIAQERGMLLREVYHRLTREIE